MTVPWQLAIKEELAPYNQMWKDFIMKKSTLSENRLEYIVLLSDEMKDVLESLSFELAYWYALETSTGKKSASIGLISSIGEHTLYITFNPNTKEVIIDFDENFMVIKKDEKQLVKSYLIEFGIIEMVNKANQKKSLKV